MTLKNNKKTAIKLLKKSKSLLLLIKKCSRVEINIPITIGKFKFAKSNLLFCLIRTNE